MMYAIVVAVLSLISCIWAEDQVRMTMLSKNHFKSEDDGWYQCHLSNPDKTGTTVTSFRTVNTMNNGMNPEPPNPTLVHDGSTISYYNVPLEDNGSTHKWFGVFGCGATRNDKKDTIISTTRMRSDATFVPANELFTQTVNVGDEDVTIIMESPPGSHLNLDGIRWRKDNSNVKIIKSGTYTIGGPIKLDDAGTYECQYAGGRDRAEQGLNLLLVRACPAYRWGPLACNGVCDSCYNGGICDENNGKCVCPPGFKGDNCLEACGGNTYGYDCEIQCSSGGGDASCQDYLFCLVHPYGCRCNTGWKGLSCDTACDANTFGASCLQSCHCVSNQCDRYTGACTGTDGCEIGWTGVNCQECDGTDCTQGCHCPKETCNKDSGLCKTGGCLPQWVDLYPPYSCQTGLINITYTKMNHGIPVPVTCEAVEGPQGDLSSLELVLSRDSDSLEDGNITAGERSQDGNSTTKNFTVANVQKGDMLHCQLRDEKGKLAVLNLSVEVFALPVLTSVPVSDSVNVSSVTISWSAWDEEKDVGDPPLAGYIPYYKKKETDWIPCDMVPPQTLMYQFTSLDADTHYSFSVSAVREGEGGEGPQSNELSVRTTCDIPPNPEDVTAEISGERQELVKVSWEVPSEEITCSSDVTKFTIYYSESSETDATSVDVTDTEATSIVLYDLTPGVNYTLYVTLSTSGGESKMSNEVNHLVPVLPSFTNPPTLTNITCNSITMVWNKWTGDTDEGTPPIIHYIPYYKITPSSDWNSGEKVTHSEIDEEYDFTFYNLTEKSSYYFCVVPVREGLGGEGMETETVQGDTTSCPVPNTGPSAATIAVSVTFSVLFLLLLVLAAGCFVQRREKRKAPTTEYKKSGATNNSYITETNEPVSFSKHDEQTEDEDQVVYTNLEKPVSILIADLEKYIRNCQKSRSSNFKQQFMLLNGDRQFPSLVGDKEQNKPKNRFRNMIAYDHSRVALNMLDGDPHSDYYNANYIKNVESEVAYIASQGPNKASVDDFWRMVWQENVSNIVMLTNLIEDGKDRCIQYWPPAVGATKRFGKITLKWESEEQFGDYTIRELHVELGENSRTVTNWHFKAWPDKNIPDQASPLIEFARRVTSFQKTAKGHLLVHCSAGVGRTGTFIALYSLMDVVETDTRIDIYGFVEQMRQDRIKMVQTEMQYKFLHECLLEVYLVGTTKIPVTSMENFDIQAEKEKLKKQFQILAKLDQRSPRPHAATPEESEKIRYPEIIPVEKRRPFLQTPGKTSYSNYINACFVTSYKKKDAFIATQSPLPNTVEDFWRLVFDWKCPLIVMLNQIDPMDKTCCKYWPKNGSSQFGHMTVNLKEEQDVGFYMHRQFELTHVSNQEPRLVHQMQLNSWDDNQQNITILVSDMGKLQQDYSMVAPTVVHCINGVGRTGVFLTMKSEMERMSAEDSADVFNTVRHMRGSNRSMVYTEDNYYLCHQLLKSEFPESQYANI